VRAWEETTLSSAIVTGGAGFIGSHLVDSLLADGWSVTVVDDLSTGDVHRVAPEANLTVIDVAEPGPVNEVFATAKPSAVFHLGAQSMVTVSVRDPARDCLVNVLGTLNVLEAATAHRAPVVFTSTGGALYGDGAPLPTPETHIPAPVSPYGASKWAAESYVRTWGLAHDIPNAVCRLGNVYGPRQTSDGEAGVVAIFSRAIFDGRPPKLFGFGEATRDYVHVADVVSCLRAASGVRGVFNVATGIETSGATVWETLRDAAATGIEPELAPLRQGELTRSCMDPTSALQELGWKASIPFRDGVRSTYAALVAEFEEQACRR
jgi:UDP-glucose 4-epimerase